MTEQEQRFCRVYLETMDAQRAAEEVGLVDGAEGLQLYEDSLRQYRNALAQEVQREDIIRRLFRLGFHRGSQCLKLLTGEADGETDLSLVSEIKRGSNGTVEVKLIDRVAVLKLLLELLKGNETDGAEEFLRSLQDEEGL